MSPPAEAVWFPGPRAVELRQEDVRAAGEGEVLIQTLFSGLSHGTEMLVYRGQVPPDLPLDLPTLEGSFRFPIKYGYAAVGKVAGIGPGVEGLKPGDLVFALHPHQTQFTVPAGSADPLPLGLPPENGVFLANLETALTVVLDANPRLGETAVVFGQGVVGLLITSLLHRMGLSAVVTVDGFEQRRRLSQGLGADVVFTPDDNVASEVRRLTNDAGADVVIEASGNPDALAAAVECAAFQGTIVVCSWYGLKPLQVPLGGAFHRRRLRLVSSQVGALAPELQARWDFGRRRALAKTLLCELDLQTLITHRFPIERAAEAYELVDMHPESCVQVILSYERS